MKKLRFAEWDESKHPREGGKFAPKGGGGEAPNATPEAPKRKRGMVSNLAIGAGKVIAKDAGSKAARGAVFTATRKAVGFLVRNRSKIKAAISAIRTGGKIATAVGAAETATGAGALVGVPTFLAGLAGQAIAGRYIDRAVDKGIETLAKKVGLKERLRNAIQFTAGIATPTPWAEEKHHRDASGRFGGGSASPSRKHKPVSKTGHMAQPPRFAQRPIPKEVQPSLGVKIAAAGVVAAGIGVGSYAGFKLLSGLAKLKAKDLKFAENLKPKKRA